MGLMNWLGIGSEIAKPIDAIGNLYTTDKARLEAEKDFQTELNKPMLAQLKNNEIMASSTSWFNSGWQPLTGWTAGFLVLLYYAPQIVVDLIVWSSECFASGYVSPFPMDPKDILNLVYLLFGFGGYHLINKKLN